MTKFEILNVDVEPAGTGPDRFWKIHYRARVKKELITSTFMIMARTEAQARDRALLRFGDKKYL